MKKRFKDVDDYIAAFPPDVQKVLRTLRQTIRKAVPEAEETISYDMPTYKLHGVVLHFAAYKTHYSLFGIDPSLHKGLSKYEGSGRGTIRFPLDEGVPSKLIATVAKAKAKQNLEGGKANA